MDCAGGEAPKQQAVRATAPWGRIALIAVGGNLNVDAMKDLIGKQRTVIGSYTFSSVGMKDCAEFITDHGVEVHGLTHGDPPPYSSAATAVFRPSAVAVHLHDVGGSPRNHFSVEVAALEPRGDLVRVTCGTGDLRLSADVTPQSVAELRLVPGLAVSLTVKATEVSVYAV